MAGSDQEVTAGTETSSEVSITADAIRDAKIRIDALWSEDREAAESLRRQVILRVLYTIAKKRTSSASVLAETARHLYE